MTLHNYENPNYFNDFIILYATNTSMAQSETSIQTVEYSWLTSMSIGWGAS